MCSSVEVVDDIEQPKAPAAFKLVVYEVHRPDLIDRFRHHQCFWLLAHQSLSGLDPQIQFQFPVYPVPP